MPLTVTYRRSAQSSEYTRLVAWRENGRLLIELRTRKQDSLHSKNKKKQRKRKTRNVGK